MNYSAFPYVDTFNISFASSNLYDSANYKGNIISGSAMIQCSNMASGIYQYRISEKQSGKISASGKLVIK